MDDRFGGFMRIIALTSDYPPVIGGIATFVYNLMKQIASQNHELYVLLLALFLSKGDWCQAASLLVLNVYRYRADCHPSFWHAN
jgi:hypothetical protein